jgi:hypothetical protein
MVVGIGVRAEKIRGVDQGEFGFGRGGRRCGLARGARLCRQGRSPTGRKPPADSPKKSPAR